MEKKFLKNKKASHVGMILSFVLFITFTLFIYTIISPNINTAESKRILLNEIGLRLMKNMSANFTSFSVNIDSATNPVTTCVNFQEILLYAEIEPNAIVKNQAGVKQNVYYNPATDFNNLKVERGIVSELFFKIYSSPELEKPPETSVPQCTPIPFENGYVIGSWNSGQYIFEKKMYALVNYYGRDYEGLKSELSISPGDEFAFEFTLSNGTKISTVGDLPSQNIYASDIPVQYIDDDANILSGFINIKVW